MSGGCREQRPDPQATYSPILTRAHKRFGKRVRQAYLRCGCCGHILTCVVSVVSVPAHLRRETGTLRFPQTVFGPRLSLLDTACAMM